MPKRTQPAQNAEPIGSDLIRRLLDKDSAFRAFIRRRIDNPAVADDVLQQAFVRAIEHHHSVRDDESVVAWFYRVLRNTIIDYYRTQGVESRRNEALLQELTHLGEDQERPFDELQDSAHLMNSKRLPANASMTSCLSLGQTTPRSCVGLICMAKL
jgi:RNA polymerase sigma factor (sigma-70 family)